MTTKYEITTPGHHEERTSMNASAKTIADARTEARRLAQETRKPMLIERVTARGNSTIVERIEAGR
jgi:hypothetical protein